MKKILGMIFALLSACGQWDNQDLVDNISLQEQDLSKISEEETLAPQTQKELDLLSAANNGNLELVEAGADIHTTNARSTTPVFIAFQEGHSEIVQYLLEQGAETESRFYDNSLFVNAVVKRDLALIGYLLEQGEYLDITDPSIQDRLVVAAYFGDLEYVQYLIEELGIDVDATNQYGQTALMFAASRGDLELIQYLLEQGADFYKESHGNSVLPWYNTAMFEAAYYNVGFNVLRYFIEELGIDVDTTNSQGQTALMWARTPENATYQSTDTTTTDYLLSMGADPEKIDIHGNNRIAIEVFDVKFQIIDGYSWYRHQYY